MKKKTYKQIIESLHRTIAFQDELIENQKGWINTLSAELESVSIMLPKANHDKIKNILEEIPF